MILRSSLADANPSPIVQEYHKDSEDNSGTKNGSLSNFWERFCEENPSEPECKIFDL